MQREGLATKPCARCYRDGRELRPPKVYAVRDLLTSECSVVYECELCGEAGVYPIPQHLLLAANVRTEVADTVDEATPAFFYSIEHDAEGEAVFWLDPADGLPPVELARGTVRSGSGARARAAIDFLNGGDGRRPVPKREEPS